MSWPFAAIGPRPCRPGRRQEPEAFLDQADIRCRKPSWIRPALGASSLPGSGRRSGVGLGQVGGQKSVVSRRIRSAAMVVRLGTFMPSNTPIRVLTVVAQSASTLLSTVVSSGSVQRERVELL